MPLIGPEGRKQFAIFAQVATVGVELVVSIALGYLGGRWLDSTLGTYPWLQWAGLVLGLAAGFWRFFQVAQKVRRELEQDDDGSGNANH